MKPAKRCRNITPFIVMDILEAIKRMEADGINVIHMEIGEPDFNIPESVKKMSFESFAANETSYTHSLGDIRLRKAISEYHKNTYNTLVDPEQILVTSGTSPAMLLLFSTIIDPGDEVIISDPHYACYTNFIYYAEGVPVAVPVYEQEGFVYNLDAIRKKITPRTKAVLINSPSNPTGNLIPGQKMREIVNLACEYNLHIISDEIYHGLVYDGQQHSILEYTDRAFLLNGFSKLFAMTGLRLGYMIVPFEFIRILQVLQQNFFICANSVIQLAGIAALTEAKAEIDRMKEIYNIRRKYMIKRLKAMGLGIGVEPTGAFYVFANAKHVSMDSYKLAFDILDKVHIGVTPGIAFGNNGEGYLRFSYANSMENLVIGMDRMETYLKMYI